MKENISVEAAAILDGLNEVLADIEGKEVSGIRKTVVNRIEPKAIRENMNMSQSEFSNTFGIPLATLQNWEQGRRKLDNTAIAFLKTIMKFPNEVRLAQLL